MTTLRAAAAMALAVSLAACGGQSERDGAAGAGGVAGAGGAGTTGGAGGGLAGSGGALLVGCEKGLPGPQLIPVETPGAWYCIDSTEVSSADYAEFLATNPPLDAQPSPCVQNQSWQPGMAGLAADDKPARFVDWCDARAYCEWAGKRLCGRRDGGAVPFGAHADIAVSEWHFACTRGGEYDYPYSDTFTLGACGGKGSGIPLAGVDACHTCGGGIVGLFCMSGNVAEWEDSCDGAAPSASCHLRGGALDSSPKELRCDAPAAAPRSATSETIGFRCCADAAPL
jgi:formylglycine-generating enzyme required for sulfatase activity